MWNMAPIEFAAEEVPMEFAAEEAPMAFAAEGAAIKESTELIL